jgi:hypothetical protein
MYYPKLIDKDLYTFDVRRLVRCRDVTRDNALVQAAYDTVNRMVGLIGDVPFQDLFLLPWKTLMPRLRANVDRIEGRHDGAGVPNADAVRERFSLLGSKYPQLTFATFGWQPSPGVEDKGRDALEELWRQGIYLGFAGGDAQQTAALVRLLALVPTLTYHDVHTKPASSVSPEAGCAVRTALASGIMFLPTNNYCCFTNANGTKTCRFKTGEACTCADTGGTSNCGAGCSLGSTYC